MRVSKLAKPGPIIISIWLICYLIWAFYLPYEWIRAIRKFLFEEHLNLKTIKSFGVHVVTGFLSLPVAFQIFGIFLLVALAIGVALGINRFKGRTLDSGDRRRLR
jgi:hypothetical protein